MAHEPHLPLTRAAALACALALAGGASCRSGPRPSDVPAVLVAPTPADREALARAVSEALGGSAVTLADDALTHETMLIIDRVPARDPETGLLLDGRERSGPELFSLVDDGGRCVLVQERTGRRATLDGARCAPLLK